MQTEPLWHDATTPFEDPLPSRDGGSAWSQLPPIALDSEALCANGILTRRSLPESRPFDALRTRTRQRMHAAGWRRLAICSPKPEGGASTVALNLAFSFARKTEDRIVSIEANLAAPSHLRILAQPPRDVSIVRMFEGRENFAAVGVRAGPALAMAFATHPRDDDSDILQGSGLRAALDRLDSTYAPSLMVFDAPPLLEGDAAMSLLEIVDCALIVARADRVTRDELDLAERLISEQTNLIGIVLNGCRFA